MQNLTGKYDTVLLHHLNMEIHHHYHHIIIIIIIV